MNEKSVIALYEAIAKIFELREDCKITIKVKQK
jgi:hypothetical protein